jgi:4-amino-4-deoxy-L-arabinose transferase-like glycosyltransferase
MILGLVAVIGMAAGVYLVGNGRVSLWDRDEPRYAMASRWMGQSGDWVVPRVGWGWEPWTPRTAKPVFTYWCQAGAMMVFGPTVFAARFPSAVAMVGVLIVVAWGVSKVSLRRALWAAGILGSGAMVIAAAKMCITDAILLLWVTIAQVCLFAIYFGHRRQKDPGWGWVIGLWVAMGLAGLTKGPVVVGVQLMTMVVLAVFDVKAWRSLRGWGEAVRWWRKTRPLAGLGILLVIVGPWLVLLQIRAPEFLSTTISHDVVKRVGSALEGHKGPPGFYLATIWGTWFPWSLLLPLTIVIAWRHRRLVFVRFALAAVIGPWIMMELVQTKLVHYVLPIFPPLAFLTADAVVRCLRGQYGDLKNRATFIGAMIWGAAVIVFALLPWVAVWKFSSVNVGVTIVLSASALMYAAVVLYLFWKKRPRPALISMGAGMGIIVALAWGVYLPVAGFMRLSPRIAKVLVDHGATGERQVLMMGYKEQSLAFYQGGTIDDAAEGFLIRNPREKWPLWLVMRDDLWNKCPPEIQRQWQPVDRLSGWNYSDGGRVVTVEVLRRVEPAAR